MDGREVVWENCRRVVVVVAAEALWKAGTRKLGRVTDELVDEDEDDACSAAVVRRHLLGPSMTVLVYGAIESGDLWAQLAASQSWCWC